mmetsp:Transcript_28438/g.42236  ORF Transcript_28438/g.42236 Transcript_28438/m.42236 type:complete len:399 (-) Transcript_28438:22-1218(-)
MEFKFGFQVPSSSDISSKDKNDESNNSNNNKSNKNATSTTERDAKVNDTKGTIQALNIKEAISNHCHYRNIKEADEASNVVNLVSSFPYESIPLSSEEEGEPKSITTPLKRILPSNHKNMVVPNNTDLIPGVYEGGLKVWECSLDLCHYITQQLLLLQNNKTFDKNDLSILELGCGHGLPSCLLLRELLGKAFNMTVLFSDYNEFVLRDVTLPNVLLNTLLPSSTAQDSEKLTSSVGMVSGDWLQLSNHLSNNTLPQISSLGDQYKPPQDGKFDVILMAETTYTTLAARQTAFLILHHLKLPLSRSLEHKNIDKGDDSGGVAFVASKRYYFGVGGGVDVFREECQALKLVVDDDTHGDDENKRTSWWKLQVETIQVYDNGKGNIRELLKVTPYLVVDE